MPRVSRLPWTDVALLAPAVLLFLFMAGDGIRAGLFPDEMMNIYGYWKEPWLRLLRANLFFFDGGYRPAGALFYRPLFDLFGFNPLPYRLVCFALLLLNLVFSYSLTLRLSSSRAAASLAAVAFAYNAYCSDLYYSSGTIFDLLCFSCFSGACLLYVGRRQSGRSTALLLALIALLQILALNAKEMAVTLPLALALYELLFHQRGSRDFRAAVISLVIVAAGVWGRLVGFGHMTDNPAYRPSLQQMQHVLSVYVGQLLYVLPAAGAAVVASFIAAIMLCAGFNRQPHIRFAALWPLITPLPVLLIQQRSLYVMYIPMLGLAMLAGSLIASILPARLKDGRPVLLLPLAFAALLLPRHIENRPASTLWLAADEAKVRSIVNALDRQLPSLPKGSRVYFTADPFAEDDWILTMLFRLYYRDDSLVVNRSVHKDPGPEGHYAVLRLRDNPWTLNVSKP